MVEEMEEKYEGDLKKFNEMVMEQLGLTRIYAVEANH
jgi:hypothetical protein